MFIFVGKYCAEETLYISVFLGHHVNLPQDALMKFDHLQYLMNIYYIQTLILDDMIHISIIFTINIMNTVSVLTPGQIFARDECKCTQTLILVLFLDLIN